MASRSNIHCLESSAKGILSCGEVRALDADMAKTASHEVKNSSRLVLIEDSDQCSVGSCSSNNLVDSCHQRHNFNKAFADSSDNSDAESSFPSSAHNIDSSPSFEEKVEADMHELECHAYKSTVRALYALGPLSWEQGSLLTNLRLSFHISDEEHLLQLRHLLSTQVV